MTGLNTQSLTRMRDQITNFLPDTCTLYAVEQVSDGAGGTTDTWTPVEGGTVNCRLDPLLFRDMPQDIFGREAIAAQFTLTVPYDAPIAAHQRVELNGDTYEVQSLADDHSWRVARRAYVSRLD
jgi:hypothetical protein